MTLVEYDDDYDDYDDYEDMKFEEKYDKELQKKMNRGYFVRNDNRMIFYEDIAKAIETLHPELIGRHIFIQLKTLGLYEDFINGSAPCSLPYSFTEV